MNRLVGVGAFFLATSAVASGFNPATELSKRTGLPLDVIQTATSHCDASQTNTNICAWYEQVKAEHDLQTLVAMKRAACPACKNVSKNGLADWQAKRDGSCKAKAQEEWGGGSMEPAAEALCATAATREKIKSLCRNAQALHATACSDK